MVSSSEIAAKLKQAAKDHGRNMKDVLSECGLAPNTVSKMGAGADIRLQSFVKLCDSLGCSADELLNINKKSPASISADEAREQSIIQLCQLTPDEFAQVDAFVQGLLAKRTG